MRGRRARLGQRRAAAAVRLAHHLLHHVDDVVVLVGEDEPGAEPGDVVFLGAVGQRILAEQVANLHHGGIELGRIGTLADPDDVAVVEQEVLPLKCTDHGVKGSRGQTDVLHTLVIGSQAREVELHHALSLEIAGEALDVFEQQALLAERRRRVAHPRKYHEWKCLPLP